MESSELSAKKQEIIDTINKMIELCPPISMSEFNRKFKAKDVQSLRDAEKQFPKLGIANFDKEDEGISVFSVIATITDIVVDDRLAFSFDGDVLTGVVWYSSCAAYPVNQEQ